MSKWIQGIALVGALMLLTHPASAQDYRARVQGTVADTSQGALPGAVVTLTNAATGVATTRVTDTNGRYLFDFVDPGTYVVHAELEGFKAAQQQNVRVPQRGDVTVGMVLELGTIAEMVTVTVAPSSVQFHSSSTELTMERQLIDQAPVAGRNPYNLASLDPTILTSTATNENRPYHHAYANDYDAEFDADLDMTAMDLAMVWSPGPERMTGFEVFGGLRYIDTKFHLVIDPAPPGPPTPRPVSTRLTRTSCSARATPCRSTSIGGSSSPATCRRACTEGTWSLGAFGGYTDRAASFLRGLPARRNGPEGGTGESVTETYVGTRDRLRFQLLRSDSKQLKNKAKSRVFLV